MRHISTDYLKTQTVHLDNIVAIRQYLNKDSSIDHMKNGRNNNALVYFCTSGAHYISFDGTRLEPKVGDAVYIPAGSKYKLKINEDVCEVFTIFFQVLDKSNERSVFSERIICTYTGNTQLPRFMIECARICDSTVGNGLLLSSYMYNVLHEFVFCCENKIFNNPVDVALSYINENLDTAISVKNLALDSGMSESAFRRIFKERVGQSPLKYINSERTKKAALLLKETDLPVATISNILGFYDVAHLVKKFKETYICSPSEYRKTIR